MLGLLNRCQRGFPLEARPFAAVGRAQGVAEDTVLDACRRGIAEGTISRVGVVFAPGAVGASTLAAMQVPAADLERVAAIVSAQPEVNHNYEREHELNLWFVATAATPAALDAALARIASLAAREVIALPLVEEFHIDLGFDLETGAAPRRAPRVPAGATLDEADLRLVAAVQGGLEVVPEPYAALAARAGLTTAQALERLRQWLEAGVARRIGVVLRHDALGYNANAMAVWDLPDADVSQAGARMARHAEVTLCYRRERVPPRWRYNLYCMLHGRDRAAVEATLQRLAREEGLAGYPHAVLFSTRCFKQRGARYADAA